MPQINDKDSKRIKILSQAEIKDLYNLPQFTAEERAHYFALDPTFRSIWRHKKGFLELVAWNCG